ncbi:MAG: serine protease [Verrucomicrobiota bacterium]
MTSFAFAQEAIDPDPEPESIDEPDSLIINGRNASPGEYPFMVGLLQSAISDNHAAFFCGGSLIDPEYILTAAHCVDGFNASQIDVWVGSHQLSTGGRRIPVSEIIIHPGWFGDVGLGDDVAILKLSEPVTDIQPIGLVEDESWQRDGLIARAIGWGLTNVDDNNSNPEILQELDVTILDYRDPWGGTLDPEMIPVQDLSSRPGEICFGDSGSALLVQNPVNSQWVVAGVASFGDGCDPLGEPTVYARVLSYRNYVIPFILEDFGKWMSDNNLSDIYDDPDRDGRPALVEFAFNEDPRSGVFSSVEPGMVRIRTIEYVTIAFNRRRGLKDVVVGLQQANETFQWQNIPISSNILSIAPIDADTERVTVRAFSPAKRVQFLRLIVTQAP